MISSSLNLADALLRPSLARRPPAPPSAGVACRSARPSSKWSCTGGKGLGINRGGGDGPVAHGSAVRQISTPSARDKDARGGVQAEGLCKVPAGGGAMRAYPRCFQVLHGLVGGGRVLEELDGREAGRHGVPLQQLHTDRARAPTSSRVDFQPRWDQCQGTGGAEVCAPMAKLHEARKALAVEERPITFVLLRH